VSKKQCLTPFSHSTTDYRRLALLWMPSPAAIPYDSTGRVRTLMSATFAWLNSIAAVVSAARTAT
jgi:hypothetical protein